jgi:ribose 5-phosphate isomerase B
VRLAQASRAHNNANVLCLGADVVSDRLAKRIATAWLATPFEGGRHRRRVAMVDKLR